MIQALKNLGKNHIDQKAHLQISKFLKDSPKEEIKKNMKFAPAWIRALVFEIMELAQDYEDDAILIQQEASELVCSIALGGVSKKPDVELHDLLKRAPLILLSLDFDELGKS